MQVKIQKFQKFVTSYWGYDVTKGGSNLEMWNFNMHNRILRAKISLHDNIQRFITFPQENINILLISPNFDLNWGYDVTKEGLNFTFLVEF